METSGKADEFDWTGEEAERFAHVNSPDSKGKDAEWVNMYGKPATEVLGRAVQAMRDAGIDVKEARVIDIGCSTGGMLSVLEKIGFTASNLQGVDLSPAAIEINKKEHPNYHVSVVQGYEYGQREVDLVYHSGFLCQIPEEDYPKIFGKIREMKPKFYMFIEGINPRGYEKIPNSMIHGHGGHGHGGHEHKEHGHEGHEQGGHGHGGHGQGGHEGHGGHGPKSFTMEEGYHHTNNMEKVVEMQFPEAKKIFSEKLNFTHNVKTMLESLHMMYTLCNVYAMTD